MNVSNVSGLPCSLCILISSGGLKERFNDRLVLWLPVLFSIYLCTLA